ncbi:MAG: class I SAM-dependent methyltransferase [Magnetococcales bacterium]|nr:class I SAM-dependent methyltransferase [Magnetococcales bacterium]
MACYICGCKKSTIRDGQVRDNPNAVINQCDYCGLVFLTDISLGESVDDFYRNSGMHDDNIFSIEQWLQETKQDDARRFNSFKEQIIDKSILDFGCGAGGFLLQAKDVAKSLAGIELEKRLSGHFLQNGLEVTGDINDFARTRKFDIITAFHVLEHLPDPRFMLKEFAKYLAEDGKIIIEVPNADDALLTLYENEPFSKFTYWSCHLYLFNAANLGQLVEQVGMHISSMEHKQRYPLSNHLFWLAKGKPGGDKDWHFLDSPQLRSSYENALAKIGKTDTIIATLTL